MGTRDFVVKTVFRAVDKTSKVLGKMHTRISRFAARANKSLKKVGSMAKRIAIPITLLGAGAVKAALDINKAMASVGSLIPKQTKLLESYKKEVMDLAAETGVSSTVIAEGLYETISAFGNQTDTMDKLTIATKMSKAGLSEVKESLSLVSAVTKGYGDQTADAVQKASDLAFLTVKLGQTTFPELASSMGKIVPMASTLGVSQEELFGSMATLTGVTGTASEVSTQLTAVLGAMIKPSAAMTKASKELGYESSVAMVKEIGLGESLKKLGEYTKGDEIAIGKLITRKEGLNTALTLLGPQAENFAKKTLAMGKAAGATDEAYRAQTEGINKSGHAMDQATEKIKNMGIEIGDKLLPKVAAFVSYATTKLMPVADWITKNFEEIVYWVEKIGTTVAIFYAIAKGIQAVNLAFAMNPIILIVGAIIAAIAAIIIFRKEIKEFFMRVVEYHMDLFQPVIDAFVAGWEYVGQVFHDVWQGIKDFGGSIIDWIMKKIGLITSGFGAVADFLGFGDDEGGGMAAAAGGGSSGSVVSPIRPSVNISQSSSESVEKSEVTIKDETGRAKQTKGKNGRGFKLVHSGAMP